MADEHAPAAHNVNVPAAPGKPGHVEEINKPAEELPSSGGSYVREADGTLRQTQKPTATPTNWKRDEHGVLQPVHEEPPTPAVPGAPTHPATPGPVPGTPVVKP